MLAKLRWIFFLPIDHLLPLYLFMYLFIYLLFFVFLHLPSQDSSSFLLLLLPQTSKPFSQNPKPKNHDLEIGAKTQTQNSRSQHRSTMGLTNSAPERLRIVDLSTKGPFSMFYGFVCLLICFLFFLGWCVSDGIFSVVGLCFLGWSVSVF